MTQKQANKSLQATRDGRSGSAFAVGVSYQIKKGEG